MQTLPVSSTSSESDGLLTTIAEYWMKARIDQPLATVERLDQNAKQLLTLAGVLQGLLVAVIKLANINQPEMLGYAIFSFVALFVAVICAACAFYCSVPYIGLLPVLELLKGPRDQSMVPVLGKQLEDMCRGVDTAMGRKKKFLVVGLTSFVMSLSGSLMCLLYAFDHPQKSPQSAEVNVRGQYVEFSARG